MLNRTLMGVLMVATAGLANQACAQPDAAPNAGETRTVVAERVVSQSPMVIERTVVIGKLMTMPDRNTGISKSGGTVGGAIGGYYINGTTPADNLPLDIPSDAYTR